ncbi:unnamed protein product, partial [Tenebrio molitor]
SSSGVNISNYDILTIIGEKLQKEETKGDEFDAVGINVSCKLRRLPGEMKIFAEKLINDVLFYAELGRLSEDTAIMINPRLCPSGPPGSVVPHSNSTHNSAAVNVENNNISRFFSNYPSLTPYNYE